MTRDPTILQVGLWEQGRSAVGYTVSKRCMMTANAHIAACVSYIFNGSHRQTYRHNSKTNRKRYMDTCARIHETVFKDTSLI